MLQSSHESVAIAQSAFYVLIIPTTIYLLVKNWHIGVGMSRMLWITLVFLALIRFIGGILIIAQESNPTKPSLTITSIVLLNIGLVPLIIAAFGMMHIILSLTVKENNVVYKITTMPIRILVVAALSNIIAGAVIGWNGKKTGQHLILAGYILYAAVAVIIIIVVLCVRFGSNEPTLASLVYQNGAILAIPFLLLRTVYAILSSINDLWNPFSGSAVIFALAALLPEYITVIIYSYLGFHRIRENTANPTEQSGNEEDQVVKCA